jgi:serine/threonine protein kinase
MLSAIAQAGGARSIAPAIRARTAPVAIKVLPAHLADKPELRDRLEREARTIASLNHPHICTLHDIGHQDGIDDMVLECLEGETLAKCLKKGPQITVPAAADLKPGLNQQVYTNRAKVSAATVAVHSTLPGSGGPKPLVHRFEQVYFHTRGTKDGHVRRRQSQSEKERHRDSPGRCRAHQHE